MTSQLEFRSQITNVTAVILTSDNLNDIEQELAAKLEKAPQGFFTGKLFIADLAALNEQDIHWLSQLKDCFKKAGLSLIGISNHHFSDEVLYTLSLTDIPVQVQRSATSKTPEPPPIVQKIVPTDLPKTETLVIKNNIHSGQRIYAKDCDLTVIGSVGAGAEIIADGNINVLGSLRGRAFAGAADDVKSQIFCLDMDAELVAIAGNYQTMEQLDAYRKLKNCLITLQDDESMQFFSL